MVASSAGKSGYGGTERRVKYWARLGCWFSPCYGPFSLGAHFETYEPFISWNFKFFSGRGKPRVLNQCVQRHDSFVFFCTWLIFLYCYVLASGDKVNLFNPLTLELNPSAQHCMTRFFTEDFASWTVHFVNIYVKNQQILQLIIQFINYVW
jgi:hypothetical protein